MFPSWLRLYEAQVYFPRSYLYITPVAINPPFPGTLPQHSTDPEPEPFNDYLDKLPPDVVTPRPPSNNPWPDYHVPEGPFDIPPPSSTGIGYRHVTLTVYPRANQDSETPKSISSNISATENAENRLNEDWETDIPTPNTLGTQDTGTTSDPPGSDDQGKTKDRPQTCFQCTIRKVKCGQYDENGVCKGCRTYYKSDAKSHCIQKECFTIFNSGSSYQPWDLDLAAEQVSAPISRALDQRLLEFDTYYQHIWTQIPAADTDALQTFKQLKSIRKHLSSSRLQDLMNNVLEPEYLPLVKKVFELQISTALPFDAYDGLVVQDPILMDGLIRDVVKKTNSIGRQLLKMLPRRLIEKRKDGLWPQRLHAVQLVFLAILMAICDFEPTRHRKKYYHPQNDEFEKAVIIVSTFLCKIKQTLDKKTHKSGTASISRDYMRLAKMYQSVVLQSWSEIESKYQDFANLADDMATPNQSEPLNFDSFIYTTEERFKKGDLTCMVCMPEGERESALVDVKGPFDLYLCPKHSKALRKKSRRRRRITPFQYARDHQDIANLVRVPDIPFAYLDVTMIVEPFDQIETYFSGGELSFDGAEPYLEDRMEIDG